MSLVFHYNLVLKRNDTRKILLPDLKSSCLILRSFEIVSEHKAFDIKLIGKDTIISYGEAVFYQSNKFDLSGKLSQIIDAGELQVIIKNLCNPKDLSNINVLLTFNYSKLDDGIIIFNNVYTNLNPEGLSDIMSDLNNAGKYITKFIWTSPNKLSSIELLPQFKTEPIWLKPIKELANANNQIIMDLMDTKKYDPDFSDLLKYYNLVIPDNIEKLGIIVYGYP